MRWFLFSLRARLCCWCPLLTAMDFICAQQELVSFYVSPLTLLWRYHEVHLATTSLFMTLNTPQIDINSGWSLSIRTLLTLLNLDKALFLPFLPCLVLLTLACQLPLRLLPSLLLCLLLLLYGTGGCIYSLFDHLHNENILGISNCMSITLHCFLHKLAYLHHVHLHLEHLTNGLLQLSQGQPTCGLIFALAVDTLYLMVKNLSHAEFV